MKTRVSLLVFVSMLVAGAFMGAAAAPPVDGSVNLAGMTSAPSTDLSGASPCGESGTALERAIFASDSPSSDPTRCGACSVGCNGAARGELCWSPSAVGNWGFCHPFNLSDVCSEDGQWRCFCVNHDMS